MHDRPAALTTTLGMGTDTKRKPWGAWPEAAIEKANERWEQELLAAGWEHIEDTTLWLKGGCVCSTRPTGILYWGDNKLKEATSIEELTIACIAEMLTEKGS